MGPVPQTTSTRLYAGGELQGSPVWQALAGHKRRIPLAVVLPRPARGAGPGLQEESGPVNKGWGSPRGSPNFCSRVDPAWVAAARRAWGPRAGPTHSGVRSGALPDSCTSGTCRSPRLYHTPPPLSLCVPLSAPGASRMLSRVYNRELSRGLSKATARTGGSSGERPFLLLSSPRPAPCSAAPPQCCFYP